MDNIIKRKSVVMKMEIEKAIKLIEKEEKVYHKSYRMFSKGLKRFAGEPVELKSSKYIIDNIRKNSENGVDVYLMEDGYYMVSFVPDLF